MAIDKVPSQAKQKAVHNEEAHGCSLADAFPLPFPRIKAFLSRSARRGQNEQIEEAQVVEDGGEVGVGDGRRWMETMTMTVSMEGQIVGS